MDEVFIEHLGLEGTNRGAEGPGHRLTTHTAVATTGSCWFSSDYLVSGGSRPHSKDFTPYLILTTSWAKCSHYPHLQLRSRKQCLLTCPGSPEPMCLSLQCLCCLCIASWSHPGPQCIIILWCRLGRQQHRRAPSLGHRLVSGPVTDWNLVKNRDTWEQAPLMWLLSVSQMSKALSQSPFPLGCQGNAFGNTRHTF